MTSDDSLKVHEDFLVKWRWRNLWAAPVLALVGVDLYLTVQTDSVLLAQLLAGMILIGLIGNLYQCTQGWIIWVRRRRQGS
jgi:hypothetical protein